MDPLSQQTQQPATSQPDSSRTGTPAPESKKVGPIIVVLIVVLVLIVGALYLFASRINDGQDPAQSPSVAQNQDGGIVQPIVSGADDVDSLEADLEASTKGLESQSF